MKSDIHGFVSTFESNDKFKAEALFCSGLGTTLVDVSRSLQ